MILADLVSNIGGLLGIFVGYSLISFSEIIELMLRNYHDIDILFSKKNSLSVKTSAIKMYMIYSLKNNILS